MEDSPAIDPLQPRRSGIPLGLRGRFMAIAATLLCLTCITLGSFFVHQRITILTDGLYQSGALLAENLAANSRYGLISGDHDELARLAHGILSVKDVSYVSIFTADGRPMISVGKGLWEKRLTASPASVSPINPALTTLRLNTPAEGEVHITEGNATFSSGRRHSLICILTLLAGQNMPLFFDIGVPIHPGESTAGQDSSLRLLFERQDEPVQLSDPSSQPLLGIVEVGMSSLSLQDHVRHLLWEAIGITTLILAISLLLLGFFSHRITDPLRQLADAANRAAAGDTAIDVRTTAPGEIGDLARVFSYMLRSIRERETALHDLNHSLESRIAANTDELRIANNRLLELNRRKSLFVSTASHELKTPLTSITCHLDNLLEGVEGPLSKEQVRAIGRVQANIKRLHFMLLELLDLCKIEIGEVSLNILPVSLQAVVNQTADVLQPLAAKKGVRFDVQISPALPFVSADPEKLSQIAINLLHNALKFSPDNGLVVITGQQEDDGFVHIAVRDAGCGIAREEAGRIFEPFYRSKHASQQTRGTGLGLTITKQLVEFHQGQLWVESEPGAGACFCFTLPVWTDTDSYSTQHGEPTLASKQVSLFGSPGSSASLPR